jgi:hypothetical protein
MTMNIEECIYDDVHDRANEHIFFSLVDFEHNNILFSPSVELYDEVNRGGVASLIKSAIIIFLNDYESKTGN